MSQLNVEGRERINQVSFLGCFQLQNTDYPSKGGFDKKYSDYSIISDYSTIIRYRGREILCIIRYRGREIPSSNGISIIQNIVENSGSFYLS